MAEPGVVNDFELEMISEAVVPYSKADHGSEGAIPREVNISLKNLLVMLMAAINGPAPVFRPLKHADGLFQLQITIDTNKIPHKQAWSVGNKIFASGWFMTYDAAEKEVCTKVLDYVVPKYDIEVQDLSYRKIQKVRKFSIEAFRSVRDIRSALVDLFEDWDMCIGFLKKLRESYSHKTSETVYDFDTRLFKAANDSSLDMASFNDKFSALLAEDGKISEAKYEQAKRKTNKEYIPGRISEKDLLDEILRFLETKKAKYTHSLIGNSSYRARCKMDLSKEEGFFGCGKTKIGGCQAKSAYDAECSSATAAISFLEREFRLTVIDLNYEKLLIEEEEANSIKEIMRKYCSLGRSVIVYMKQLVTSVKSIAYMQNDLCQGMVDDAENEEENNDKIQCSQDINELLNEIESRYEKAAAAIKPFLK